MNNYSFPIVVLIDILLRNQQVDKIEFLVPSSKPYCTSILLFLWKPSQRLFLSSLYAFALLQVADTPQEARDLQASDDNEQLITDFVNVAPKLLAGLYFPHLDKNNAAIKSKNIMSSHMLIPRGDIDLVHDVYF